jgi:Secretion system C-terminal sorting domain
MKDWILIFLFIAIRISAINATVLRDTFIESYPVWQSLGPGLNNDVHCIKEYKGLIYVVGKFFNAGGNSAADHIAIWNGTTWQALGAGLNHTVLDILLVDNKIYACGGFTDAGGDPKADYIAVWDGQKWGSVGGAVFSDWVMTLEMDTLTGSIYAGGLFKSVSGDTSLKHIVMYDQTKWEKLGQGFDMVVYEMIFANGALFAGGDFANMRNPLSRYDGTTWQAVDIGSTTWTNDRPITQMTLKANGDILCAVRFDDLVLYDGTKLQGVWSSKCNYGAIESNSFGTFLGVDTEQVECHSDKTTSGALLFDPEKSGPYSLLLSLDYIFTGSFYSIEYTKTGDLYVGGSFGNLNNVAQNDNIAYAKSILNTTLTGDIIKKGFEVTITPNPAQDQIRIQLSDTEEEGRWQLEVFNMSGIRLLQAQEVGTPYELDITQLSSGCYIIACTLSNGMKSYQKLIVAK